MAQTRAIVDKLLTNVSLGYLPSGHIAEVALPTLQVQAMTGLIGQYTNQHLRIEDTQMGGEAMAKRVKSVGYDTTQGYEVGEFGLEDVVTPADIVNIDDTGIFKAESDKVMGLTHLLKVKKEKVFADLVTNASVITQGVTLSGTTQWSDYVNSLPINDIKTARGVVKAASGFFPNRAIMSPRVAEILSYHPHVLNNIEFNWEKAGGLTFEDIKKFLKVDILHIGDVHYETAVEGLASSLGELWVNDVVLYYAPTSAGKFQKSLGYYLQLAGKGGQKVYKAPIVNPPGSTSLIVKDDYGFKITNAPCAYLITNAIA